MYVGKILLPVENFAQESLEELEREFGNLKWVSDRIVLIEVGETKLNPVDQFIWPSGTRIVLSWEEQ